MPPSTPPRTRSRFARFRIGLRDRRRALRWAIKNHFDMLIHAPWIERQIARRLPESDRTPANAPIQTLYVDMSVISNSDAGTGIQRVVRSIYACIDEACPAGIELRPLYIPRHSQGYRTAEGQPLAASDGALFLGLDFSTEAIHRNRAALADFVRGGGRIWIVLHDVLPITRADWFTQASQLNYRRWLRVCLRLAEGIVCVSPVVADELRQLIATRYPMTDAPQITTMKLGHQITPPEARPGQDSLPASTRLTAQIWAQAALVVGTLEPRKGHADVLDAFDLLWRRGIDIPLILIGRAGWNTDKLQKRIRLHPEHERRLFWLDDVDDRGLWAAYSHCRMTIVPSLAEGYGLPLDEALTMGSPVLARDIPVFRRHDGADISYFAIDADADTLAQAIMSRHQTAQRSALALGLREVAWSATTRQLLNAIGCPQSP